MTKAIQITGSIVFHPDVVLNQIQNTKIRYYCLCYIERVAQALQPYFHVYIKEHYIDESEIELVVGYAPKHSVGFVSRYLPEETLAGLPEHIKHLIKVDTKANKNIFFINKYNLYNQIAPILKNNTIDTTMSGIHIKGRFVLDDRVLINNSNLLLCLNPQIQLSSFDRRDT